MSQWTARLSLLVVAGMTIACPPRAPRTAPERPPRPLSHFLCYQAATPPVGAYPSGVQVKDQFLDRLVDINFLRNGERFCNPVHKNHGDLSFPPSDRDHHLVAIVAGIPHGAPSAKTVTVYNQFFPDGQELTTSAASMSYFMVPAYKRSVEPKVQGWREHEAPKGLSHFMCYPTESNQSPDAVVDLLDEVRGYYQVALQEAALLCNPAEKRHGDEPYSIEPVRGPEDHLVCYTVERAARADITATHQLWDSADSFAAERLAWLCVPSRKVHEPDLRPPLPGG